MSYRFEAETFEFENGQSARSAGPPRPGDDTAFREFEAEIIDKDNRTLVKDTTPIPYRFICRLYIQMAEQGKKASKRKQYVGTGILIGNRHVLTVAHNIVRQENGVVLEAEKIKVAPGYNGALANPLNWTPFGTATVDRTDCYTEHQANGFKDSSDYSLIVLKEDLGLKTPAALKGAPLGFWGDKKLGGLTVVRATTGEQAQGTSVILCGYQADKCRTISIGEVTECDEAGRGSTQWSSDGRISGCVGGSCKGMTVVMHDADACHGASGAPLWTIDPNGIRALIALHRGGENDSNYAVCLTEAVLTKVKYWISLAETRARLSKRPESRRSK